MLNKLIKSISGVYNKYATASKDNKLYYLVVGSALAYAAINLVLLIQLIWVT
jgi:hypothetical protein